MKKRWVFSLVCTLSLSFALFIYIGFYKAHFISKSLSKSFNLPVTVESMTLSSRGLILHDVHIENPPGCSMKDAFLGKTVEIRASFFQIIKFMFFPINSQVSFNEIKVSAPEINIELFTPNGSNSNWMKILSNLSSKNQEASHYFSIGNAIFSDVRTQIIHSHVYKNTMKPPHIGRIQIQECRDYKKLPKQEMLFTFFGLFMKRLSGDLGLSAMFKDIQVNKNLPSLHSEEDEAKIAKIARSEHTNNKLKALFEK